MQEIWIELLTYAPGVWRRRWWVLAGAWLICVIGWFAVALIPNRFQSAATVYVDTQSLLQPLLRGIAIDIDPHQQVELLSRQLNSNQTLERVVKLLSPSGTVPSGGLLETEVASLRGAIKITSTQDNVFTISCTTGEAQRSYSVVQALLNIFVESNFGDTRRQLDEAQAFLQRQVTEYGEKLKQAEDALSGFKEENVDLLSTGGSYLDALAKTRQDIQDIAANISDLKAKAGELQRQLGTVPAYVASATSVLVREDPLAVRVRDLEAKLDVLRLKYNENHPDIVATKTMLADLKAQLAEKSQNEAGDEGAAASAPNDAYRQIKVELVDTQAEIASETSKLGRRKADLERMEQLAGKMPVVDAKLRSLTRDVEVARQSYDEIGARLRSAQLSENRETEADKIQFRVIDPPSVPIHPTGLKRSLLLSAVLAISVAVSAGAVLLSVILQTTFVSTQALAKTVDCNILGCVSLVSDVSNARVRLLGLGMFLATGSALLMIYASLMLIEHNIGVSELMPRILRHTAALAPPSPSTRALTAGLGSSFTTFGDPA